MPILNLEYWDSTYTCTCILENMYDRSDNSSLHTNLNKFLRPVEGKDLGGIPCTSRLGGLCDCGILMVCL